MTPVTGCRECGLLACVCVIKKRHRPDCRFRLAAAGPVGIPCRHGFDVCPKCDPCKCPGGVRPEDFGPKEAA